VKAPPAASGDAPTVPATLEEAHDVFSPVKVQTMGGPTHWTTATNTWNGGDVPEAGDRFAISHAMTISGTLTADCGVVLSGGTLTVADGGEVVVDTLQVVEGGTLVLQPGATLTLGGGAMDATNDPDQYWGGLLVHGRIEAQGTVKTGFVRLGATPAATDTTLTFAGAVTGWQAGDTVVVPDSRQRRGDETPGALGGSYVSETETRTLSAVAGDNLSATVTALTYAHPAAVDSSSVTRYRPHVMNLTRDTVIRSAAPDGVRAHTLYTHNATGFIKGVEFRRCGRTTWQPLDAATNHIGRYPCHVHHLANDDEALFDGEPDGADVTLGNRFLVEDCSMHDAGGSATAQIKWGVTIHASHWCKVNRNVIYNHGGAGLMAESGTERGNLFKGNFVIGTIGNGGRPDERGSVDIGYEGTGGWDRNWLNRWEDNVVADTIYGAQFWMSQATATVVPTAPASGVTEVVDMTNTQAAGFDRWEVYGGRMMVGILPWSLGTQGVNPHEDAATSTFNDLVVWHTAQKGFYNYEVNKLIVDGFIWIGQRSCIQLNARPYAFFSGDYVFVDSEIRNFEIHNAYIGIEPANQSGGGTQIFRDGFIDAVRCVHMNVIYRYGQQPGPGLERQTELHNVEFHDPELTPNDLGDHYGVHMDGSRHADAMWFTQVDELRVYDWNGEVGEDFQVFYDEQHADAVVPTRILNGDGTILVYGTPVAGLTNEETWETYEPDLTYGAAPVTKGDAPNPATPGMAFAGAVMPGDAIAKTGVKGKVKAI
jgi:hypothetical protein